MPRPTPPPAAGGAPVLLTRAAPDNAALAARLRAAGVAVLEWPALATDETPAPDGPEGLAARCRGCERALFTSRRGVEAFERQAGGADAARALLEGLKVAAVGPSTAARLGKLGVVADLVGDGSGALALVPRLALERPSRLLLVRSRAADDELPRALEAAGIAVSDLSLHGPVEPPAQRHPPRPVAAVACASPSAARRLLAWNPWLADAPFVAIGPTTARALESELGVRRVTVARRPDDDSLFRALAGLAGATETDTMHRTRSEEAHARASRVSPGGVHSPVRAFRAVGGTPVHVARGEGSRLIDLDGNSRLDFCLSWGPLILGHAHPAVVEAVREAAGRGLTFGASHPGEADLAEAVLEGYPELERVRFVSSGTEAVMTALRLARAATGRTLVLKFEGGYHGHLDALLVAAGSGLATFGTASSAGVPPQVAATTLVAPFDDEARLEELFAKHGGEIACVAVEPVPANDGLLVQRPEWLRRLRELCTHHGALLLFDEVITGFRLRYGGAGPILGVQPDLVTLGKIVGGGMPVGAVAGPAALMDRLAPLGPVYQAGTLSGNPVAMAAGRATLARLRDGEAYRALEELGGRFEARLRERAAPRLGLVRMGSILWPWLGEGPAPRRPDRIEAGHVERFRAMHGRLLDRGFYLPPSAREVLFLSTAHAAAEVESLADALADEALSA